MTVRIQSVLNVCCKAEPNLTTRLETDSDSGKQREHLSLLSVTGLDMRGVWSGGRGGVGVCVLPS